MAYTVSEPPCSSYNNACYYSGFNYPHSVQDMCLPSPGSVPHQTTILPDVTSSVPAFEQKYSTETFPHHYATMPTSAAYSGECGFEMGIQKQTRETKSAMWTYDEISRKLYVRLGVSCPFSYRTCLTPPPQDCSQLLVRITPLFARSEDSHKVVHRCPNHANGAAASSSSPLGVAALPTLYSVDEAEKFSFVHAEHPRAAYVKDAETGRISVVLPFEMPQAGADWVTILLQFHCFSSCVGGLNRRPVLVVFTLERKSDGGVIGRQAIEVRVCACPGRDRQADQKGSDRTTAATKIEYGKTTKGAGKKQSVAVKRRRDHDDDDDDDDQVFTLNIHDRHTYEILSKLNQMMEFAASIRRQQQTDVTSQPCIYRNLSDCGDIKPICKVPTQQVTSQFHGY